MDLSCVKILGLSLSEFSSIITGIVSLFISVYFGWKTINQKTGEKYGSSCSVSSSIGSSNTYISKIDIENFKDKCLVVYEIYYRVKPNIYILIESFEDQPLVIQPFSVYHQKYDPVLFYSRTGINDYINCDSLLRSKGEIICITGTGKHKKHSIINRYFNNYAVCIIRPYRLMYKNKSYGDEIKFIVDVTIGNKNEIYSIEKDKKNRSFHGEKIEIQGVDKSQLKNKLTSIANKNKKRNIKIEIIDWEDGYRKKYDFNKMKEVQVEKMSYLYFYTVRKIYTWYHNIKSNLENGFRKTWQ